MFEGGDKQKYAKVGMIVAAIVFIIILVTVITAAVLAKKKDKYSIGGNMFSFNVDGGYLLKPKELYNPGDPVSANLSNPSGGQIAAMENRGSRFDHYSYPLGPYGRFSRAAKNAASVSAMNLNRMAVESMNGGPTPANWFTGADCGVRENMDAGARGPSSNLYDEIRVMHGVNEVLQNISCPEEPSLGQFQAEVNNNSILREGYAGSPLHSGGSNGANIRRYKEGFKTDDELNRAMSGL